MIIIVKNHSFDYDLMHLFYYDVSALFLNFLELSNMYVRVMAYLNQIFFDITTDIPNVSKNIAYTKIILAVYRTVSLLWLKYTILGIENLIVYTIFIGCSATVI